MYAYTPTDAGDLALQPNDRIQVLEHMNNDCKFSFDKDYDICLSTNTTQGGVAEMSEQTRKEYSLEAMSEFWTRSPPLQPCPSLPITETCLWMSLNPDHLQLTPAVVDLVNLRSKARNLEGRWAMPVSLVASGSVEYD